MYMQYVELSNIVDTTSRNSFIISLITFENLRILNHFLRNKWFAVFNAITSCKLPRIVLTTDRTNH